MEVTGLEPSTMPARVEMLSELDDLTIPIQTTREDRHRHDEHVIDAVT
jgi:hypothetical protein